MCVFVGVCMCVCVCVCVGGCVSVYQVIIPACVRGSLWPSVPQ